MKTSGSGPVGRGTGVAFTSTGLTTHSMIIQDNASPVADAPPVTAASSESGLSPSRLMAWVAAPKSRCLLLQSLVTIALSYELLFGNESIVSRWIEEVTVVGLLASILAIALTPRRFIERRWFMHVLVGFDTVMTAGSVYLSGNAREEFYLSYFLLILIATSAGTLRQMIGLSLVVCAGYGGLLAQAAMTIGDLQVGHLLGLPVLVMMALFYGLTLEELGAERRRGDGLSHRLAELRLEEEHLTLTRDRLMHETTRLKQSLAAAKQKSLTPKADAVAALNGATPARGKGSVPGETRQHMERLAQQVAMMLQDVARQMGRETGALRSKVKRDDPAVKHVEQILLAGERAATMAMQLQGLVHSEPPMRQVQSLNTILTELEPTLREMLPDSITLALDLQPDGGFFEAAPGMTEFVVVQLVLNAREAMGETGHMVLASRLVEGTGGLGEAAGGSVHLVVRDTGRGMTAETQARLMEPFFTTKARGGAWGLGLTKVQSIMTQLGGALTFHSLPGQGTEVTVAWPRYLAVGTAKTVARVDAALCAQGSETVLVVEEDEATRKWTTASLRRAKYHVLEARSGIEAMLLTNQHAGAIQLLVTNLIMPEMAGVELAERLFHRRPSLKALFTSSYPEESITTHRISARYYLQKPYRQDELLRKVREALDS